MLFIPKSTTNENSIEIIVFNKDQQNCYTHSFDTYEQGLVLGFKAQQSGSGKMATVKGSVQAHIRKPFTNHINEQHCGYEQNSKKCYF